jgi:hypothetical protein
LLACTFRAVYAQDECELKLIQATDEFNAGHLYGIPALLKDCLDRNQNREWRQRAYLLLAETYLLLEDPLGAEQSYLNVLRANPEFVTDPGRDPIDLVYLSGKFTATPIWSLYGFAGPNISPVRTIHDVRIGGEARTSEYNIARLGWHAGVGADFNYNDYLSASASLTFQQLSFKHRTKDMFGPSRDIVEFIDHQSWISVPLSVKLSEAEGKFRRYGYVGASWNYLMGAKADVEGVNRDLNPSDELEFTAFPISASNVNIVDSRQRNNFSFFFGGGVRYKSKLDYFFVDLRYAFGMKNVVNPDNRYNSLVDGLPLPYVDDDFRIDNLAISVGYVHPLYKPRKLKKARTKSVLRKIQKNEETKK